ncbi:Hypp4335 [Branchiostoma lanceolatum]|uniref:Hypp4335 protein n=1 Tax=Branchiostoma lanceolatum TaxID=7740 RepID=A0A8K0A985_BRALA|nr:Hypp4335 [Branchiostoma lanceolatum]
MLESPKRCRAQVQKLTSHVFGSSRIWPWKQSFTSKSPHVARKARHNTSVTHQVRPVAASMSAVFLLRPPPKWLVGISPALGSIVGD